MSCSIITIVNPHSERRRPMSPVNSAVSIGFMPATGSSRRINWGCVAIARAISSRLRLAYDSMKAACSRRYPTSRDPKKPRAASARSRISRSSCLNALVCMSAPNTSWRVRQCWLTITFSRMVMLGNRRTFWNVRAMPRPVTWCGSSPRTDSPSNKMSPSVASTRPEIALKNVVLPAPLGPITLTISPSSTWKFRPDSAFRPPNVTFRSWISRRWLMPGPPLPRRHSRLLAA